MVSDWYLLWRYRRRPYIEYYRAVMRRNALADPKTAIGGKWETSGPRQLEYAIGEGLKPNHSLLDFGCGSLRGGLHFIRYLDKGNYTGNDISPEIIDAGKRFLHEAGLEEKQSRLVVTHDLQLKEFEGQTFDYIYASSVLTHMPPSDIDELFRNIKNVMKPSTKFLATAFLTDESKYYTGKQQRNFYYPDTWMRQVGAAHGLRIEVMPRTRKQHMMRITLNEVSPMQVVV